MNSHSACSIPPGPKGRWLPTLQFLRDPRETTHRWAAQYGDPFCIHALNGSVVLTGRAELIREIFSHDPMDYDVFATKAATPLLGAGSMLLLAGQQHRRERKLIMPMFHGDRMRAYANIMQQAAIDAIDRQPADVPFNMLDVTTQISLRVIVQAIFGGEEAKPIQDLTRLSEQTIRRIAPILLFSTQTHIRFLGLSPWDRFMKAKRELETAFDAEVERRRREPRDREDILTMMLQAKYEDGSPIDTSHARDELGTFLFAGHETTAIAMAWAIYHLHKNPATLTRLKAEVAELGNATPEALAQQPYLKAVVQETLRMNPVVTEVLRVLKQPMQLDKYTLPAGTAVAPAAILAHYNTETFPDPDSFRPERFLENNFSSVEYLPFGGGHRRCAGAAFASYEMAIVLGTILARDDFELLEPKPVVPKRRNVTMGPSTGIRVRKTSAVRSRE